MNKATKNLNIVLGIILIAVLALTIYLKISINKDIEYIAQTKAENFAILEKVNSLTGLKNMIEEAAQVGQDLDVLYVDRENILDFIETIEGAAGRNNLTLTIDSVNLDETNINADPVPYGILKMAVTANGNFNSLLSFTKEIEDLPHMIDFNATRLARAGGDGTTWTMNIALTTITN